MSSVDFRYRSAGYIALNVTDIDQTTEFATDIFALTREPDGPNGERFFRCGPNHHDVVLHPSDKAGFLRHGWLMETPDDVEKARQHFEGLGLNPQEIAEEEKQALGIASMPAFRMREPTTKAEYDFYSRMEQRSSPADLSVTNFKCYGHFGLVVPECKKTVRYMEDNMGFITSDYVGDFFVALMRAFPNPNHHSFAPLQHPQGKCTFHHLAFMVNEIDDIGKLFNRVKKAGVGIAFGIGRHPTSGSIHLYVYDPDDMVWEYTLGMEQFPEAGAREARQMSMKPEDFDLWGAMPDPGFLEKGADVVTE